MKTTLGTAGMLAIALCCPASAQDSVKSEGQTGGVTAGSVGVVNQLPPAIKSPYLKDLQSFYYQGSVLARGWGSMPPDVSDKDIDDYSQKSADWVNATYTWIYKNITPAAAERFVQIIPTALTFNLGGSHSQNTETKYSNWRYSMPQYVSNLNALMASNEMYPQ